MTTGRVLRWIAAAGAAAALTTSCAKVPTSGPAVSIRNVPPVAVDDFSDVRLQPLRPSPGDPPEDIVRGFLSAVKSAAERRGIARSYLASPAGDSWRDDDAIQIINVHDINPLRIAAGATATQVRLTGRVEASLAADGAYVPQARTLSIDFKLRQVDGEWRITNPPPGVLLLAEDFRQVYRTVDLFFLTPDGATVVPDRRYLDVTTAALPTRMATALLAGASDWLAPGVRTAFPVGTRLRSNVTQDGDYLVVDLTSDVLAASRSDQIALAAQLVWTLVKRFSVAGLRLLADGRPLPVENAGGLVDRALYGSYDPRVLITQAPGFYLAKGSLRAFGDKVPVSRAAEAKAGLLSAAMSVDRRRLAGVRRSGSGMELVAGAMSNPFLVRYRARTLSRPSWEAGSGAVFVVADGNRVVRIPIVGGGSVTSVNAAGGLARVGPLIALVLSRDGVRAAIIAGPPGAGRLLVGVLTRSPGQLSITGLRWVTPQLTDVLDVAWSDEAEMLVLGSLNGAAPAPHGVDVAGAQVTEGTVTGLPSDRRHVAAAPGMPDLVEAGGQIWQRTRSGWGSPLYERPPNGTAPFYPG